MTTLSPHQRAFQQLASQFEHELRARLQTQWARSNLAAPGNRAAILMGVLQAEGIPTRILVRPLPLPRDMVQQGHPAEFFTVEVEEMEFSLLGSPAQVQGSELHFAPPDPFVLPNTPPQERTIDQAHSLSTPRDFLACSDALFLAKVLWQRAQLDIGSNGVGVSLPARPRL